MEIRITRPEEQEQVNKIESIAFVFPMHEDKEYSGYTWGCFSDQGDLGSVVTNWPFSVFYNGKVVKMGGIGGVASLPETRMQGGVRALFSEIIRRDQENGVVFSTLYPFSHTYYRKYGYEVCTENNIVTFPTNALAKYRYNVSDVKMVETMEDVMALAPLNERFSSRYNMALKRDEVSWKRLFQGDYKKAEEYRYALTKKGETVAYIFFEPIKKQKYEWQLSIKDFAYDGEKGLYALLSFLYKLSPQYTSVRMELPPGFPLDSLLDDPYEIGVEGQTRWMARLVDIEAGLCGLKCPEGDWQCTIRLRDLFLPYNSGIYQMMHNKDGLEVIKVQGDEADLSVSIQALTQLCLGHLSLEMACLREDTTLYGNEMLLQQLFTKKRIYMIDKF